MEVSTIIGIVVAIIICIVGLRMILRKPDDVAPSLDSALHINQDTQKPVIPRHVRDQLQAEKSTAVPAQRVEPSLTPVEPTDEKSTQTEVEAATEKAAEQAIAHAQVQEATMTHSAESHVEQIAGEVAESKVEIEEAVTEAETPKAVEPEFSLNPNVETAQIQEFNDESSILDINLHEQQRSDDESSLANAETIIALNVYPNPRKALSGDKTLKVLLKYGLRFGEMRCFHRYEDPENPSPLLFSILRITDQGPEGFDLESLLSEQVKGLAFFLALPHQNVQKGYDSMVSIAGLIAREIDGTVYDENNLEFTPQLKEHWRHKAIDYRPGQAV